MANEKRTKNHENSLINSFKISDTIADLENSNVSTEYYLPNTHIFHFSSLQNILLRRESTNIFI